MKVVTAEAMQKIDEKAINQFGIPGVVLMENAGLRVVEYIVEFYEFIDNLNVTIIAGKGNNGGDGFVVARHLDSMGANVTLFIVGDPEKIRGDARINYDICKNIGLDIKHIIIDKDLHQFDSSIKHSDLSVDALFGTGLTREISGLNKSLIDILNSSEVPVLAIDTPSGVNADNGQILGVAVKADWTITFALPKQGLLLYPGSAYAGEVKVVDIGIPKVLLDNESIMVNLITKKWVQGAFPYRDNEGHKGSFGKVFLLAGSPGMTGAAVLAAESAQKSGAGVVILGCPRSLNDILEVKLLEVMTKPLPETPEKLLAKEALTSILEDVHKSQGVGFGPGIGQGEDIIYLLKNILYQATVPVVIDADGLNALSGNLAVLQKKNIPVILTPHPGEMARLTGLTALEVNQNRIEITQGKAKEWDCIIVLKGAKTVIALPSGQIYINTTGNDGMACGGSGDVLTGLITGLIAQGLTAEYSAIAGVFLHGLAGDIAAKRIGKRGLVAGDLLNHLPLALKEI